MDLKALLLESLEFVGSTTATEDSASGGGCLTGKGAEIVLTSKRCEPVECETKQNFNE